MNCESKVFKLSRIDISREDMEKYEGEYVVIFEKEVVEHSKNISEIIKLSENYPIDKAIITKISPREDHQF
jgi:hypothetical protein